MMNTAPSTPNRDQELVRRAKADPGLLPLPLTSSPFAELLSGTLTAISTDRVEMSFFADARFSQSTGVLQGGVLTSMMDFAMACAALGALDEGETASTAMLNVCFLRPAAPGRYVGQARVVRQGRTVVFMSGELLCALGRTVATSTAAFTRMTRQPLRQLTASSA